MDVRGQDLGEDISDVVPRGHEDKAHHLGRQLLTEPRHLDAEVAVPASDDMVVHHCHTCLVVLVEG